MRNNKILGTDSKTPNTPLGFKFDLIKNLNKSMFIMWVFYTWIYLYMPSNCATWFWNACYRLCTKNWLVESKSLKTYIHSFRNYGIFHEEAVMKVD